MSPEQVAAFDQTAAFLARSLPPMLREFLANCLIEGFPPDASFQLTRDLLTAFVVNGFRSDRE